MNDEALTALWREILRTARPGARVIFRTAADERLLPGRVPDEILAAFSYDAERSRELGARDRSSIYGAFHLYVRHDADASRSDRRRRPDGPDVPPSAPHLRSHAQILSARPRRADRRARAAAGARVLEIGCGTGRNLIRAAKRYPAVRAYRRRHFRRNAGDRPGGNRRAPACRRASRVAQGDATAFDPQALFGVARFERVFISYALSMIPPWREAVAQAARLLAPGGSLHIVDFGDQRRCRRAFRTALRAWLELFDVHPRVTLERGTGRIRGRARARTARSGRSIAATPFSRR